MRAAGSSEDPGLALRPDAPSTAYALLGDGRTAALVAPEGSIDWWCPTRFDGASVFGRILDPHAGHFAIGLPVRHLHQAAYVEETNVHKSSLWTSAAHVEVTTAMPHAAHGAAPGRILRLVRCTRGSVDVRLELRPRFAWGRRKTPAQGDGQAFRFEDEDGTLTLRSSWDLDADEDGIHAVRRMERGDAAAFVLAWDDDPQDHDAAVPEVQAAIDHEVRSWRAWIGRCTYRGLYAPQVRRSLLALGLMQHAKTGSFVAAPTTSISEWPGGPRTWDYRYAWLRDGVFIVWALDSNGYTQESDRFRAWLASILRRDGADRLQMLYRVDGGADLEESSLLHLRGHRGSRPVRIGNAAAEQHQLDTFGELMMCFHRTRHVFDGPHGQETWDAVRGIVDWVADNWKQKDSGLWEQRGPHMDYVYSKGAAWIALDHGLKIARHHGFDAPWTHWENQRDALREHLESAGFDAGVDAYVQSSGRTDADAASLLLPLLGVVDAKGDRMQGTLRFLRERLLSDGWLYRYDSDDRLPGPEGAFVAAGFWLAHVHALRGEVDGARVSFERTLAAAGPLGLLPEEVDPSSGAPLGNYPQALSHLSLVNAALAISQAEEKQAG